MKNWQAYAIGTVILFFCIGVPLSGYYKTQLKESSSNKNIKYSETEKDSIAFSSPILKQAQGDYYTAEDESSSMWLKVRQVEDDSMLGDNYFNLKKVKKLALKKDSIMKVLGKRKDFVLDSLMRIEY
jgi:hypothetical protein